MTNNMFLYKCFFQEEQYINLDMRLKYVLALLYSLSSEDDYFPYKQIELANRLNISKQLMYKWITELKNASYLEIEKDNRKTVIKVNRPDNKDAIPLSKELVCGKYESLSYGAKIFYSYYSWLQEKENKDYLKIRGIDIIKPMGRKIKSIQKYYKELEEVGLLEKGKEGSFNTFNFKKI
ncbi:TPA: hypothetical protein ACU24K_002738 [Staphylococcus aureus]|uniref:hypothetical protein n=1 Tax=Staphylococcus haemolyticus TaxID=1283 RepID=UPI0015D6F2F8|nr:hypothetical protein [Staphylococcus haemolyticus]MDG6616956.1 hypothetical protein [Staphylococcus aureus]